MNREKILNQSDRIILVFLTIQVFSVGFSIALSSISFGIWAGIWILQLIFYRHPGISDILRKELKYFSLFVLAFIIFDVFSRAFALMPESPFLGLKRYLLFFVFFGVIAKIRTRNEMFIVLRVILVAMALISVYEIISFAVSLPSYIGHRSLGEIRLDTFAHSITTGEIKMIVFVSLFPLVLKKGGDFMQKKYLIPALLLVFLSLYITQSRNVFVAVFVCFIITGIVINRKFLYIFLLTAAVVIAIMPSQLRERITSIANPEHPSNNSRIIMWKTGWKMFLDRPVIGIGDNQFIDAYKTYKNIEYDGEGSHLHSNYMMVLATHGILGFAAYAGMFILLFLKHLKYYRENPPGTEKLLIFGCLLAAVSFHISGIFEWNFGDWEILTLLLFFTAVPFALKQIGFRGASETEQLH